MFERYCTFSAKLEHLKCPGEETIEKGKSYCDSEPFSKPLSAVHGSGTL